MTDRQRTDVLGVGAGPFGLTFASNLVRRSTVCRILDQESTDHEGSHAWELVMLFDRATRKE